MIHGREENWQYEIRDTQKRKIIVRYETWR